MPGQADTGHSNEKIRTEVEHIHSPIEKRFKSGSNGDQISDEQNRK